MKNKRGFTLVELLAVIVLLAIVALIGYTVIGNVIQESQESGDKQSIIAYSKAVDQASVDYYATHFKFPDNDWIKENVKINNSEVSCDDVQFNIDDDIILNGCTVNNSDIKYCFSKDEVKECNQGTIITKLYGNSIQNGIPSPESPVEIQSVGDKTANLFDISKVISSKNVVNNNDGTLSVTPSSSSSGMSASSPKTLKDYAPSLKVGKTYVLSAKTTGNSKYIHLGSSKFSWFFGKERTITQEDLDSTINWYANGTDTTFTALISNIQIQEGNSATDYEPYGKYKIPITVSEGVTSETVNIYLDMPLRKVGTVADYIDFENETIVRNVETIILDGKIGGYTSTSNWYYAGFKSLGLTGALLPKGGNSSLISNKFENLSLSRNNENGIYYSSTVHFIIRNNSLTEPTKDSYQNWLSTNNVIVQYQLAEPLISSIDLPPASFFANKDISIGTSIKASFDTKETHYTE